MMKILYFDCFAGISGDMTLGALIDLGIDKNQILEELEKLNIDGYEIRLKKVIKNGISANSVDVRLATKDYYHKEVINNHFHNRRNLFDINKIIEDSRISDNAKILAKKIFMRKALAESKVHGEPIESIYFHEEGAIDSIIDIVGTAICIDILKPDRILSSVVNDGHGFVTCRYGQIPVPVPATVEIFANSGVILRQIDIPMELVTPTGAAIIAELAESYGSMPEMNVIRIGIGAGKRTSRIPNILRIILGEVYQ